jgi:hypothetical protein
MVEISECGDCVNRGICTWGGECIFSPVPLEPLKQGIKYDTDKFNWLDLFMGFKEGLKELAKLYNFGAKKYGLENWKKVEIVRYKKSLLRHMIAFLEGESGNIEKDNDGKEFKTYHVISIAWTGLALYYLTVIKKGE